MPGADAGGQLNGNPPHASALVRFALATDSDDAALRRLLRDNPMSGDISLSLEREPNYFAAAKLEGDVHRTIAAYENGRIICAGNVSTCERFVNGVPVRIGYLGGLRLDSSSRNRISILRRGFEFFHQLHQENGPPLYLTSIASDNLPARRLFERGIRGMPTYHFLGEFVSLAIACKGRRLFRTLAPTRSPSNSGLKVVCGLDSLESSLFDLMNNINRNYQFSPVWSMKRIQSCFRYSNLGAEDYCIVVTPQHTPTACAAIWDQRSIKQVVVRGYAPYLRSIRPVLNAAAKFLGRPQLPAVGQSLEIAYISHLTIEEDQPELMECLIENLRRAARSRKLEYLVLGLDVRHPYTTHIRRVFRPREYLSRLYAVTWEDGNDLLNSLDNRLLAPEVALL